MLNPFCVPCSTAHTFSPGSSPSPSNLPSSSGNDGGFFNSDLPKKIALLLGIVFLTRLGTYLPIPGVDRESFAAALQGSAAGGVLGYVDALSGGSISKVGVFSLGIVPYINASIIMQLLTAVFPDLKKMQRDEGPAGRRRFALYQKVAALFFAVVQAFGQLNYVRPFVTDFSPEWLVSGRNQGPLSSLLAEAASLCWGWEEVAPAKHKAFFWPPCRPPSYLAKLTAHITQPCSSFLPILFPLFNSSRTRSS